MSYFYKLCKHIYPGKHITSPLKGPFKGMRTALKLKPHWLPRKSALGSSRHLGREDCSADKLLDPGLKSRLSCSPVHLNLGKLLPSLRLCFCLCKVGMVMVIALGPGGE